MRGAALEPYFKELAVVAPAEGRPGAGDFSLAFWLCGDHHRRQTFELPSWPLDFRFAAAARKPAEILHLKRKRGRKIQIGLESEYLPRAADFLDQPVYRSFVRSHFHKNPCAPKDTAREPQRDAKARCCRP